MEQTIMAKDKQSKTIKHGFALAAILLVGTVLSGCTVNRVSILPPQLSSPPIGAHEVKYFPSVQSISEPWRLEGMISVYTLPGASNTQKKRKELVSETAAGLGINAIVGLQPDLGSRLKRFPHSTGLLASAGYKQKTTADVLPKFIVCMPPLNF